MEEISDKINFESFKSSHEYSSSFVSANSFSEDLQDEFYGSGAEAGLYLPWKPMGWFEVRPNECTVWSGYNGHGKSLVLGQVCISLMSQGAKFGIASMEMTARKTLSRMARQACRGFRPSQGEIQKFSDWADGKLWILNKQESIHWVKMIGIINYAREEHGINHFIIDSMMKCGIGPDDQEAESAFMEELTAVAQHTGMHLHLVAHGRKPFNESQRMSKYDIRGSGHISDKADNVIIVNRNKKKEHELKRTDLTEEEHIKYSNQPDAVLTVDKQRHGSGEEGDQLLWYNKESTSYSSRPKSTPPYLIREWVHVD